jgi:hypothetical protein
MNLMLSLDLAVNENIIQINRAEVVQIFAKYVINEMLKEDWVIA